MISYKVELNKDGDLISEEKTRSLYKKLQKNYEAIKAQNQLDELFSGKYAKSYKDLRKQAAFEACIFLTEYALHWNGFTTVEELKCFINKACELVESRKPAIIKTTKQGDFDSLMKIAEEVHSEFIGEYMKNQRIG